MDNCKHNGDLYFEDLLSKAIKESQNTDQSSANDSSNSLLSDSQLTDLSQEYEFNKRSEHISEILRQYQISYESKTEFQIKYRKILFWACLLIVGAFSCASLYVLKYSLNASDSIDITGTITVIGSILTFAVAILELVKTITKYCFPEKDEKYIVKIVESIQQNDLAKYKEINRKDEAAIAHKVKAVEREDPPEPIIEGRDEKTDIKE